MSNSSHPIREYLGADHERLGELLEAALVQPDDVQIQAYDEFRAGLLRHIGLEERYLFPPLRRAGGRARAMAERLHQEHAALAALLIPPPTPKILTQMHEILESHNRVEEGRDGLYAEAERLAGPELAQLVEDVRLYPDAVVARHYNTAQVWAQIDVLLARLKGESDEEL